MTDQNMCEIVVILDRSGSMASVREAMQEGFNGFIAAQQRVPGRCAVTLVQFDSQATETIYEARPIHLVPALHLEPRGGTPLLDAIGSTIASVGDRLLRTTEWLRPGRVLNIAPTVGGVSAMFTAATESTTTYRNGGAYTISHTQRAAMKDDVTTGSGGV